MTTDGSPPPPIAGALAHLQARGFIEQVSDANEIEKSLDRACVTLYSGFDPTGRSLHAGHLVPIMALRVLQRHGHRAVVLLGGGTARVGDPSGKNETRRMLDDPTIDQNVAAIARQFGRFVAFGPDATVPAVHVDNAAWLGPQRYIEFLRDIGAHFTVNRMLTAKTYRDRLDAELPLSFLEFNYQLLQAFDFLHLYRTLDCTLQLGGNDQWGNMVAGVELIRRMASVHADDANRFERLGPAQCMTAPLLTAADGRKMGKTERGAVWLDPDLLSPFDYYQYWIGCDDRDVPRFLKLFTDVEIAEVDELCAAGGAELRHAKARLAYEATALAHGPSEAQRAQAASRQAFGGGEDWSAVPSVELGTSEITLLELVMHPDIAAFTSKRQARQRIEDGAVKVDGATIKEPDHALSGDRFDDATLRLQAGKKRRFRVVLQVP